jgi:hypothetical protein
MTRRETRHIERYESPAYAHSERAAGIEPASGGWKPSALPVGQALSKREPQKAAGPTLVGGHFKSSQKLFLFVPTGLARARLLGRASSSQHSMVGALLAGIEQVVGIEPDDSGVAHQRVTSTLHLLGGLSRDLFAKHLGVGDAVDASCVGRVGIEPTS